MKVYALRFNIYLGMFLAAMLICGCKTNKDDKKVSAIRIHIESNPDTLGTSQTVSVLRTEPVMVTIVQNPVLTEADVLAAQILDAPSGFSVAIRFTDTGTLMLEQYSASNPGRHFVIFGQWGKRAKMDVGLPPRSSATEFPTACCHLPPTCRGMTPTGWFWA